MYVEHFVDLLENWRAWARFFLQYNGYGGSQSQVHTRKCRKFDTIGPEVAKYNITYTFHYCQISLLVSQGYMDC